MANLVMTVGDCLVVPKRTGMIITLDDLRDANPFLREAKPDRFVYPTTEFDELKNYETPHKFWEELIHDFARAHNWDYTERASGDGYLFSLANTAHNNGSLAQLTAFYAYPDTAIRHGTSERKVQGYCIKLERFPDDKITDFFAKKAVSEMLESSDSPSSDVPN